MKLTKKNLKNRSFKCLRTIKGLTVDLIPAIKQDLLKFCKDNNLILTENEMLFEMSNGQFFFKPKQTKIVKDILVCKSTYCLFNDVRIEYKDINILSDTSFDTNNAIYLIMEKL